MLLVSTLFNNIAHPILWSRVTFSTPQAYDKKDKSRARINLSHWTDQIRQEITYLTVPRHDSDWCQLTGLRHLDLPNLKVLQLVGNPPNLESYLHNYPNDRIPCSLVKRLRPETIILKNATARSIAHRSGLPPMAWIDIKNLIFVSPYQDNSYAGSHLYKRRLPKVKHLSRLFWIFDPTAELIDLTRGPLFSHWRMEFRLLNHLEEAYPNIPITIVNVGSANMYRLRPEVQPLEKHENSAEGIFRRNTGDRYQKTPDPFTFISLDDFLEKENWIEWFDREEMEKWKIAKAGEKKENS